MHRTVPPSTANLPLILGIRVRTSSSNHFSLGLDSIAGLIPCPSRIWSTTLGNRIWISIRYVLAWTVCFFWSWDRRVLRVDLSVDRSFMRWKSRMLTCRTLWMIPTMPTSIFLPLRGVPTQRAFRTTVMPPDSKYPLEPGVFLFSPGFLSTTSSADAFVVLTFEVGIHLICLLVSWLTDGF